MPKSILYKLILIVSVQLQAQVNFNRSYQDGSESSNPYLLTINGDVYFSSQVSKPHGMAWSLYRHDASGTLRFKSIGGGYVNNMIRSLDNKVIIAGSEAMCDMGFPTQSNFITKVDTNGTVVFNSLFTVMWGDAPKAFIQHTDSSYFVFTDSLLFRFTKNGQFVSKMNVGLSGITSAMLLPNNNILVSGVEASVNKLIEMSVNGLVVTSTLIPTLIWKFRNYGNQQIMAVGMNLKLYKYTSNLTLIGSGPQAPGTFISDVVCHQDTLYTLLYTPASGPGYAVMDTSFNVISLASATTHSLNQDAICLNGSKVFILATGLSAPASSWGNSSLHYFASLSGLSKFSSNNFSSDLRLLSVSSDSSYVHCNFYSFPSPGYISCTSFLRPKIKIKNTGNSIVTKFKLNRYSYPAVDCGAYFFEEQFSGFSLQPGDSVTLRAQSFAVNLNGYSGAASSFSNEYCFYITLPNDETDRTVEDNQYCGTFNFLTTSLKEYALGQQTVVVSPNPFEDFITIDADSELKKLEVFNSLGMCVKSVKSSGQRVIIDNSEIEKGIYFLKIETEKGTLLKKMIKN